MSVQNEKRVREVVAEASPGRVPTKAEIAFVMKCLAEEDEDCRDLDAEHLVEKLKWEADVAELMKQESENGGAK